MPLVKQDADSKQMHKMRQFLPLIPPIDPGGYDLYNPRVRLVAVPRKDLNITGDFVQLTKPLVESATKNAKFRCASRLVRELQVYHVQDKFKDVTVYPERFSVEAEAQQSIRYVTSMPKFHHHIYRLGENAQFRRASGYIDRHPSETPHRSQADFRHPQHLT